MCDLIRCSLCRVNKFTQWFVRPNEPERPFKTCESCRAKQRIIGKALIKTHACEHCDKKFVSASLLRYHGLTHTGVKDFACTECDKRFALANNLKTHIKSHTKTKEFACTECTGTFLLKTGLALHMKTHLQIRDFKCPRPDCDYETSQKGNLANHIELYCKGGERGSSGEIAIKKVLDMMAIQYQREKQFIGCKSIRALPFDFYLPQQNTLIEFDGEQHFKAVDYYGGVEGFERYQKHDAIKNAYCVTNNIHLLRIKWIDQQHIPTLIKDFLAQLEPTRIILEYIG